MLVRPENVILLMTATIDPRDCSQLKRRDPVVRLRDYKEALVKWLKEARIPKVIFCENSGSSLSELVDTASQNNPIGKEIRFISYDARGYGSKGKGYGEMGIITRALEDSLITEQSMIITVSGRYHISNIDDLVSDLIKTDVDVMSCPYILPYSVLSDVYISSPRFLRDFLCPRQQEIDDSIGNYFEKILACAIKAAVDDGLTHAVFRRPPKVDGMSGGYAVPWEDTWFASATVLHGDGSVEVRRREQLTAFAKLLRTSESSPDVSRLLTKLSSALDDLRPLRLEFAEVSLIIDCARASVESSSSIVKFFEHRCDITWTGPKQVEAADKPRRPRLH